MRLSKLHRAGTDQTRSSRSRDTTASCPQLVHGTGAFGCARRTERKRLTSELGREVAVGGHINDGHGPPFGAKSAVSVPSCSRSYFPVAALKSAVGTKNGTFFVPGRRPGR